MTPNILKLNQSAYRLHNTLEIYKLYVQKRKLNKTFQKEPFY